MSFTYYAAGAVDTQSPDTSAQIEINPSLNFTNFSDTNQALETDDTAMSVVVIAFIIVMVVSFIGLNIYTSRYWDRGIFPPILRNRPANRYDAVINISVNILMCDRNNYREKQEFMQLFLRNEFPEIKGSMNNSVRNAINQMVSVKSTVAWLSRMIDAEKKAVFLRFFFDLAGMDGTVGKREHVYLHEIAEKFGLDPGLLSGWLNDLCKEYAERMEKEQRSSSGRNAERVSVYRREKFAAVLGISVDASMEEIKKSYRKLAMVHHPDKFQNEGEREKEAARMRFIEIQEAYEFLSEAAAVAE